MSECMDGWVNVCVRSCVDEWIRECVVRRCVNARMGGRLDLWMHGYLDEWMFGFLDVRMYKCQYCVKFRIVA